MTAVDLRRLLTTLTSVAQRNPARRQYSRRRPLRRAEARATRSSVPGHDSRLGQVISNLLAKRRSYFRGRRQGFCNRVPPPAIGD